MKRIQAGNPFWGHYQLANGKGRGASVVAPSPVVIADFGAPFVYPTYVYPEVAYPVVTDTAAVVSPTTGMNPLVTGVLLVAGLATITYLLTR